ncbi:MAG: RNA polymerase sigma factor [Bacteroidales bacterium]|nr:RNA polymerase sigma factor [Bacteroidales bacterium]
MARTGLNHIDDLVRQAVAGDGRAFTSLWDENIAAVKQYLLGNFHQMDDFLLDDICSRSFEKAFRTIETYDAAKAQFRTWLTTIARNTAIDVLQKERRMGENVQSIDGETQQIVNTTPDIMDSPIDVIIKNENQEKMEAGIEGLPDLYRDIAKMRLIDGMQYEEIAEKLEIPLNTVRTRIRRAKDQLERLMNDPDE